MSAQAAHESQLSIAVDSRQWPAGGSGGQGVDGPPPPPPPRPRQHERHVSLKLLVWTLVIHCLLSIITFFLPLLYLWPCLEQLLQEAVTRNFQQSVASVRTLALCNCWLVRLNRFLGYCVLTWASVIVLGGFIGNLTDFYFRRATVLIILQALQFGAATAWRSFLPHRKLTSPVLPHQKVATTSWVLHIIDYQRRVLLLKVEIPCIIMLLVFTSGSAFRPADLFDDLVHIDGPTRVVMKESLVAFSWLVFVSGLVAAAGILCGRLLFYFDISPCLGDFFDNIVRESMQSGLGGARKLSVHATVFEMVSEEYRQQQHGTEDDDVYALNEAVASQYGHMIAHVYHNDRGLETARMAIESTNDAGMQEAVVHMLGIWIDLDQSARAVALDSRPQDADRRMELDQLADVDRLHRCPASNRLRYEGALISRLLILALENSAGRVTEAAIVSLEKLARNDPLAILVAEKDAAAMLAQRIVDLVDLGEGEPLPLIREPEHLQARAILLRESLPGLIKVLIALLKSISSSPVTASRAGDRRQLLTKKQSVQLERRLLTAFQNPRCSKRLQIVAGYALHHTLHSQKFTCDILEAHLMAREAAPAVQEDILLDEHDIYLEYLKTLVPLQWPNATSCLRVIDSTPPRPGQDELVQSRYWRFSIVHFCVSTAFTLIFGIGTIPLMIFIARHF